MKIIELNILIDKKDCIAESAESSEPAWIVLCHQGPYDSS